MQYDSRIARRRFLKASAAAATGIVAGATLGGAAKGEAVSSKVSWLVRTGPTENAWEQKVAIPHIHQPNPARSGLSSNW